ncbi:MAG: UDP-N-acetylmuramoyl-L-alanine--D-glutamate ligase [Clostridiales bacterium]|nr:UDP-N-acetylmuramoyl-L-alanine--D-glutamate ligase [Clostridiales bacterium]
MNSQVKEYLNSLRGKKIAFVGLGVANLPSAKWLASKGLSVFACDLNGRDYVGEENCRELEQLGAVLCLGKSYLDQIDDMDIIFRSNGILPFQNEWITRAVERGQCVTTESELFVKLCTSKIIAVTGSNGKTTTSTLIAKCLEKGGKTVLLGGNIGKALLPELEWLGPEDYVVAELSSFQLLTMGNLKNKPGVAVVTNIESTHLDHHVNLDEYVDAKRNVLIYQSNDSLAVLNADCDYSIGGRVYHDMRYDVRGALREFSVKHPVENGAYMDSEGGIYFSCGGHAEYIMNKKDIKIPGSHNVENYLAAICALWGVVNKDVFLSVAESFGGVEHRIEFVRIAAGVKYYNDSIATSPSRVISCLNSFNEKIVMICGGSDKKNDFSPMVPYIVEKVRLLILNGATAGRIYDSLLAYNGAETPEIIKTDTLQNAVQLARDNARPGESVVLCPACPAFDQFKNFEKRGEKFKEIVQGFDA